MIEYGNGIGQVSGRSGAGGQVSGPSLDFGSVERFVGDTVQTVSTMPPAMLVVGVVVILLGLLLLKRAF